MNGGETHSSELFNAEEVGEITSRIISAELAVAGGAYR